MTTYYKVLAESGKAFHGGSGTWPLPEGKRPGKWLEINGELAPCSNGLHLCRRQDLLTWLGPVIFLAEADETQMIVHDASKVVVHRARLLSRLETWNETTARLFAADCAKDAVRRCRKAGIEIDPRVDECIRVVYRFARGEATAEERSAAESAAESAADSAAWSAADSAAWSAARSAAWLAADSAADSAARSAAWLAARSAAWLAADSAAWSAAESAAESAARSAAWSAAWTAAWKWQTKRLHEYLDGHS